MPGRGKYRMSSKVIPIVETHGSFALWREVLFHNADVPARRQLCAVSEHILYRLWEQGAHPSLHGILRHCTWDWERDE
jgi:hypothetical protein